MTETYLSLRRLENSIITILYGGQILMGEFENPITVKISQFYGIEINDFAVTVAKTALWIAESQMMRETESILSQTIDFLPLTTNAFIVEGNALRMDWSTLKPTDKSALPQDGLFSGFTTETDGSYHEYDYIMGNPPFVGAKFTDKNQKNDMDMLCKDIQRDKLDYVVCWYLKTAILMQGNNHLRAALVSTNSIVQGEQPSIFFKYLFENYHVKFDFAYPTFRWDSESKLKAHVHCVIIGFSNDQLNNRQKQLYINTQPVTVNNLNAYLMDAPNIFIEKRRFPLCNVPNMTKGSQLIDGGNFVFSEEEKNKFLATYPEANPYMHEYCNADLYLNHRPKKYCLYLDNCPPNLLKNCRGLYNRVQAVYEYRKNSDAELTRSLQDTPSKYFIANIPHGNSILVPVVSSERRKYVPLGYLQEGIIYTNATNYIPDASLYHFGVLTSIVHMAWMRSVCGRLKSDYRYSKDIVYNNFPWCNATETQKTKIEQTAQAILNARDLFPQASLADLYDETVMPSDLRRAHRENDAAVMKAYGFDLKMTESEIVSELFKLYEQLTR